MKKVTLFKYGLTALMMAFAMTLCFSCSSDDDEENNQEVNPPSNAEGQINGHAYVELAGIKWATENVDEVNGVTALGYNLWFYYYSQYNAKKAAASWGGTWTLPTEAQWQKLIDECYWEWTEKMEMDKKYNGKSGYIVSDKKDSSKFIFLPAAAYSGGVVYHQGRYGFYWSADSGSFLYFSGGTRYTKNNIPIIGMVVRPVSD